MELSAYEQERNRNIAANHAVLTSLGLDDMTIRAQKQKRTAPLIKGQAESKRSKPERPPPRQSSLRSRNLDPEGQPLPDKEALPPPPMTEARPARKPSAPLDAAKVSTGTTSAEEISVFLTRLQLAPTTTASPKKKSKQKQSVAEAGLVAAESINLGHLAIADEDIAKLVKDRIFSIAMHPSPSKVLVAAGDTWGRVGLWDVEMDIDSTPVVSFQPHSRPVGQSDDLGL